MLTQYNLKMPHAVYGGENAMDNITARDEFAAVQAGLRAALESPLPVKLNCVPQVGVNEGELEAIAALARDNDLQVRFIEMMPIGYGAAMPCVSGPELRARFANRWPELHPVEGTTFVLQLPARGFLRISPQTDPIAATVPWSIYINLQPSADNRLSGGQAHSVPPALQCSSHLSRQSESSASAAVLDNPDSGSGEHFLPHPERLLFRRPDRLPAFHTAQHPANARRSEPLPE